MCSRDQLFQVGACRGLSTGQMKMQHSHLRGFRENTAPVFGLQFRLSGCKLERVGTVHAMERTAMGDLGDKGERLCRHLMSKMRFSWSCSRNFSASSRILCKSAPEY